MDLDHESLVTRIIVNWTDASNLAWGEYKAMKARYAWMLMLATLVVSPGCVYIHNVVIPARNNFAAWWSWAGAHKSYSEAGAPWFIKRHIGVGYRHGYVDVANGGEGNVPLFPPDCYWGVWFHHPRGYEQVNAYFAGYQDGARAAHAEGISRWHTVPTSRYPVPAPPIPPYLLDGAEGIEGMEGVPPGLPEERIPLEADQLFEEVPRPVNFSEPPSTGVRLPASGSPTPALPIADAHKSTIR